ncbi:HTH_Tnp_Tc3_2 domain-containing protein [Trichonephila clavipes]|nr:HTH_Tnp_Tc3_2 domain-containing protein [Trichonephila clavipes]
MLPPRNKEIFQQLTKFERGGTTFEQEVARVQRNSSTVRRVWKQWTDEHRKTRKTASGRRKETSERNDRHLLRLVGNDCTASFRQLAARWSTATGVLMSASSIRRRLLHRGLRSRMPLYRIPARQTIDGCICNGLMSTEPGKLIGTKLSFQMNHASICGTMMAAFMLEAIPVNAAFQSALLNVIVA